MALIRCPECGKENVSDSANACPQCGFNVSEYCKSIKLSNETQTENVQPIQTQSDANKSLKIIALVVVASIVLIFWRILDSGSSSKKNDGYYHNLKCEWCGKVEDTKLYQVTSIDGYNKDGSVKYKHETVRLSDECYKKAKKNGGKYGWISVTEID